MFRSGYQFFARGVRLWNIIPYHLTTKPSLESFRTATFQWISLLQWCKHPGTNTWQRLEEWKSEKQKWKQDELKNKTKPFVSTVLSLKNCKFPSSIHTGKLTSALKRQKVQNLAKKAIVVKNQSRSASVRELCGKENKSGLVTEMRFAKTCRMDGFKGS